MLAVLLLSTASAWAAKRPLKAPAHAATTSTTKAAAAATKPATDTLPAMLGAAVTAADEERYCDALYLFESLHLRTSTPRSLYNAAEVAYAAGDRVKALDLYRLTQQRYPDFDKSKLVQSRADRVFTDMVRQGPGTACPVRNDTCGDWRYVSVAVGGEQCDDGNLVDGDGCDGNCTISACGNGIATAGEQCDDGNGIDGDGCDGNCTRSGCGNGLRTSKEQCDDGNLNDGDGCDHNCRPTGCGNGVQTDNEECDDGDHIDGDGCDSGCRLSRCGNATVTGLEQCDDGNDVNGDGCENNCLRTQVKKPLPGVVVAVLSGLAGAGGGGMLYVGLNSINERERTAADLSARQAAFAADPDQSLADIDNARDASDAASANAAAIGVPLLVGGTGLLGASVIGVGIGIWLALTQTDIEGGAQ